MWHVGGEPFAFGVNSNVIQYQVVLSLACKGVKKAAIAQTTHLKRHFMGANA